MSLPVHNAEQVTVCASSARLRLRAVQGDLNSFLWASELAYGCVLSGDLSNVDPNDKASAHLGSVPANAWKLARNGRPHYDGRLIGDFLQEVADATRRICGTVLTSWQAEFETFLETKVGEPLGGRGRWGPYARSLRAKAPLREGAFPVQVRSVLEADIWRVVRNELTHEPGRAARSLRTEVGCDKLAQKVSSKAGQWCAQWNMTQAVAKGRVLSAAKDTIHRARQRAEQSKDAPVELFCCLFAFTALDTLAHEVEEATIDANTDKRTIRMRAGVVRRKDMILED